MCVPVMWEEQTTHTHKEHTMFYLHLTLQERNVTYHLVGGLCKVAHMEEVLNNGFEDFIIKRGN